MPDDIIRNDPVLDTPRSSWSGIMGRVSWGAVWAGVMVALGMEILFTLFDFFIGFGMYHGRAANPWAGIPAWTTVWYLVTAGWSMFFGAWCAARLSGNPVPGDGILHGITTWGLATVATIVIVALGSWAVLREGIDVLGTAAIAAEQVMPTTGQVTPGEVSPETQAASQAVGQLQANAGPMAQATANIISGLSLRTCGGVLLGFITALFGGWLGRSRPVIVASPDIVPVPTRRAA